MPEHRAGAGGVGGIGGTGGEPGGPGGPGGVGGAGGYYLNGHRSPWERTAPWLAGLGFIAILLGPTIGFFIVHDSQQNSNGTLNATKAEVAALTKAFECVGDSQDA